MIIATVASDDEVCKVLPYAPVLRERPVSSLRPLAFPVGCPRSSCCSLLLVSLFLLHPFGVPACCDRAYIVVETGFGC